jgi:hypothetical protein
MPDLMQKKLATGVTTTGAKGAVDIRNTTSWSIYATATGGTSAVFTVEGTTDPAGISGWATLACRAQGGGAYATTAITLTAGTPLCRFFDPTDNIAYVRVNFSANTGPTTVDVFVLGEL